MKKIKFSAAVLMLLMFTVGCAKDDVPTISDHEFAPIVEEKFVFSNVAVDKEKDMIDAFAVMDDNKTALILVNLDNNSRSFAVYEDGEPVSAADISEPYQEICYNAAENCFYTYNAQKKQLCIMDEKFEYRDVLADNFTAFEIKNMDIVDNKLYLITVSKDPFSLED